MYFDDILIYTTSLELHVEHLCFVLTVGRKEELYVNLEKCTFCTEQITFLGFMVSAKGVQVHYVKVKAIEEWLTLKIWVRFGNIHGLASFYRKFVKKFSSLVSPWMRLLKIMLGLNG